MGEAEDIVFGREQAEREASMQADRQKAVQLAAQVNRMLPDVLNNIRRLDYKLSRGHSRMRVEGVDRVAWQVGYGYERYEYTYLLADGTFVDGDGRVINLGESSTERVEDVLDNLRAIAAEQ